MINKFKNKIFSLFSETKEKKQEKKIKKEFQKILKNFEKIKIFLFQKHRKLTFFTLFLFVFLPDFSYSALESLFGQWKGLGVPDVFGDKNSLGWTPSNGSFTSEFYYYISFVVKWIVLSLVQLGAMLFDNILAVSIYPDFYDQRWIAHLWGFFRDLINIAFIFGIIIIGFFIIFQNQKWKKMFIWLVLIAFLINFSLFFGRIIIDAGNYTTAIFYRMAAAAPTDVKNKDVLIANNYSIISQKNYFWISQKFLNKDKNFRPYFAQTPIATYLIAYSKSSDLSTHVVEIAQKFGVTKKNIKGVFETPAFSAERLAALGRWLSGTNRESLVNIIGVVLNIFTIITYIFLIKAFFIASSMVLTRMMYLIFYLVSAPYFFVLSFMPWGGKSNGDGIMEWARKMAVKSFCIVPFVIGLFALLVFIASSGIFATDIYGKINDNALFAIFGILIRSLMIYYILMFITNKSRELCEEGYSMGSMLTSGLGFVGSLAGHFLRWSPAGMGYRTIRNFNPAMRAGNLGLSSVRNFIQTNDGVRHSLNAFGNEIVQRGRNAAVRGVRNFLNIPSNTSSQRDNTRVNNRVTNTNSNTQNQNLVGSRNTINSNNLSNSRKNNEFKSTLADFSDKEKKLFDKLNNELPNKLKSGQITQEEFDKEMKNLQREIGIGHLGWDKKGNIKAVYKDSDVVDKTIKKSEKILNERIDELNEKVRGKKVSPYQSYNTKVLSDISDGLKQISKTEEKISKELERSKGELERLKAQYNQTKNKNERRKLEQLIEEVGQKIDRFENRKKDFGRHIQAGQVTGNTDSRLNNNINPNRISSDWGGTFKTIDLKQDSILKDTPTQFGGNILNSEIDNTHFKIESDVQQNKVNNVIKSHYTPEEDIIDTEIVKRSEGKILSKSNNNQLKQSQEEVKNEEKSQKNIKASLEAVDSHSNKEEIKQSPINLIMSQGQLKELANTLQKGSETKEKNLLDKIKKTYHENHFMNVAKKGIGQIITTDFKYNKGIDKKTGSSVNSEKSEETKIVLPDSITIKKTYSDSRTERMRHDAVIKSLNQISGNINKLQDTFSKQITTQSKQSVNNVKTQSVKGSGIAVKGKASSINDVKVKQVENKQAEQKMLSRKIKETENKTSVQSEKKDNGGKGKNSDVL